MTLEQFNDAISRGEKYVILDDLVVNVAGFIAHHPGGKFVIEHNVGLDISKFFYGGYVLEGNINVRNPPSGYLHSNYARQVVNKLAVAQLVREPETILCTLDNVDSRFASTSKSTRTVFLNAINKSKKYPQVKRYYNDLSILGKHYLVRSLGNARIFRHYTIANCMVPDVYQELVRVMKFKAGQMVDRVVSN